MSRTTSVVRTRTGPEFEPWTRWADGSGATTEALRAAARRTEGDVLDDTARDDNPFETLDIDPTISPRELTEELRDRAEALAPDERAHIQGLWQALTVDVKARALHVVLARPRVRSVPTLQRALLGVRPPEPDAAVTVAGCLEQLEVRHLLIPPAPPFAHTAPPPWPMDALASDPFFELEPPGSPAPPPEES